MIVAGKLQIIKKKTIEFPRGWKRK